MPTTGTRHALDGYLSPAHIDARRAALEADEEGLAGLVPVDRIIATIGGIIGGAVVMAAGIAIEVHVAGVRRRNRHD